MQFHTQTFKTTGNIHIFCWNASFVGNVIIRCSLPGTKSWRFKRICYPQISCRTPLWGIVKSWSCMYYSSSNPIFHCSWNFVGKWSICVRSSLRLYLSKLEMVNLFFTSGLPTLPPAFWVQTFSSLVFTCRLQWQSYYLLHRHDRRRKSYPSINLPNPTSNFFFPTAHLFCLERKPQLCKKLWDCCEQN